MSAPPEPEDVADAAWPEVLTGDVTDPWHGTLSHFLAAVLANGPAKLVDQAALLIETGRPAMAARLLAGMEREVRMAMCLSFDEGYHRGLERGERNAEGRRPAAIGKVGASKVERG